MENVYELLYMSRLGDEWSYTALFDQMRAMIVSQVNDTVTGNPQLQNQWDDLYQESSIALMDAVDMYREDLDCRFTSFVYLVVRRRLLSQIRYFYAKSRIPQRNILELDGLVMEDGTPYDVAVSPLGMGDPEYYCRYRYAFDRLYSRIGSMRVKDREVAYLWCEGMGYEAAGKKLGVTAKSYDGRLQRVKKQIYDAVFAECDH